MLEIVLFLSGISKEYETVEGVLTGQCWPPDTTSSQHMGFEEHFLWGEIAHQMGKAPEFSQPKIDAEMKRRLEQIFCPHNRIAYQ